jgi:hypothetical protein
MNNIHHDDRSFDRLVDGELSEAERRELLAQLDREPGGWRRCALAFLESQSWRQTFGLLAVGGHDDSFPAIEKSIRPRRSRRQIQMATLAAMAACFLAAFWIGSTMKQTRVGRPDIQGEIAGNMQRPPERQSPSSPWQAVTVSAPTGSTLNLPARERRRVDPQWLQNLPPSIPSDVLQAFNRTGHQIEQHRELVPVPMNNGRRLVVPVDQVDVHYVGNHTY